MVTSKQTTSVNIPHRDPFPGHTRILIILFCFVFIKGFQYLFPSFISSTYLSLPPPPIPLLHAPLPSPFSSPSCPPTFLCYSFPFSISSSSHSFPRPLMLFPSQFIYHFYLLLLLTHLFSCSLYACCPTILLSSPSPYRIFKARGCLRSLSSINSSHSSIPIILILLLFSTSIIPLISKFH